MRLYPPSELYNSAILSLIAVFIRNLIPIRLEIRFLSDYGKNKRVYIILKCEMRQMIKLDDPAERRANCQAVGQSLLTNVFSFSS